MVCCYFFFQNWYAVVADGGNQGIKFLLVFLNVQGMNVVGALTLFSCQVRASTKLTSAGSIPFSNGMIVRLAVQQPIM